MSSKELRGRKMRSDNVRVVPEYREHIDIEKLCQALIEIAKSMTTKEADPKDESAQNT